MTGQETHWLIGALAALAILSIGIGAPAALIYAVTQIQEQTDHEL